jgi:hypothetical protein
MHGQKSLIQSLRLQAALQSTLHGSRLGLPRELGEFSPLPFGRHAPSNPTEWASEFNKRGWAGERTYRLLVELAEIEPRIWRRVVVADTTPLPLLHRILQVIFDWKDYHLHEFKVGTVSFGVPDDEYPAPHIDEKSVRLYQLAHERGDRVVLHIRLR